MAERIGFEPIYDFSQTDFESGVSKLLPISVILLLFAK